ncbi:macro domain-containing protein [Enterococcus florum]|uniref:Macro domain-containing protein n=1 Tax=Enterococcus florum TaxID=2480627 RepID=A0A4P5PDS5_9ENTE|nr:macro domain-containing protein [Enterococcus florum]GCF94228.1 macro domain-containing protein [Enterococcus florum]
MVEIMVGDISRLDLAVDGIVNAANAGLIPGGGVDGAINRAAGPELGKVMAQFGGTPTGTAVLTPGYQLNAKYVIHAVGPRYVDGEHGEEQKLVAAYEAVFALAHQYQLTSLAIPVLSSGIYRYPKKEAARVLLDVATRTENQDITVYIVVYEASWLSIFEELRS